MVETILFSLIWFGISIGVWNINSGILYYSIFLFIPTLYLVILPLFLKGQRLFLYIAGLRMVSIYEEKIAILKIILRYLLILISFPFCIFQLLFFPISIPWYDELLNIRVIKISVIQNNK